MTADAGFKTKSVIVTGAGSGIGRTVAIQFAKQEAKVLVAELNEKTAAAVVEEIRALGGTATAVTGDMSDPAVVDKVVSTAITAHGGLDVVVNNAGIMDSMGANDDIRMAEWDRVIRVNLTAPFLPSRAALPHMLEKGKGARGVRVNAVAPGGTKTNISVVPVAGNKGPEILGGYMANMGRMAAADEVAATIVSLASDAASDITGVVLPVDGGWSAV
jgi:NAD(P)-dependent dehydrogenase (short-subunit alcohol dehydrogenase family)